ncbi:DUF1648 domain-containing protein [Porphyromonas sp.]|uniref:DUF1648 domain-containing protein n=1 Tax=Porphyromonas sp. TaxID=1924944 RepID=UPI0026DDA1C3|nr:DUF1648 domain-containing protein [Porphyromonas sp.]MDO4770574.1 DUF1648 domain-containing protein [Porphyromonas sp.]
MSTKHIVDYLSHAVVLGVLVFIAIYYPSMLEQIPVHYDINGVCDAMGHKSSIFIVVGILVAIHLFMGFLSGKPHRFSYPFTINEERKYHVYAAGAMTVKVLRLPVVGIFACITIFSALSVRVMSHIFIPFILVSLAIIIIFGAHRMNKANKV